MASFSFSLPAAIGESVAHHRHQTSLEQVLDFSASSLTMAKLAQADDIFKQLTANPHRAANPTRKSLWSV
ncbi:hypothetical protein GX50_07526 [[Emmonsia] crescens]|uniref:Uncharacterized protein n=1 Tax=[Emmonsia] crescens TaxID=73230 RepID=A0A2B7Z9M5_9EURO|nr:hypothetical protein GX50_07526 [Emmonsia crescens]